MNKARRKKLAQATEALRDVRELIEAVAEEEQDAYDNLPESFQNGTQGEAMEESISSMEDAVSSIEDIIDSLEAIVEA